MIPKAKAHKAKVPKLKAPKLKAPAKDDVEGIKSTPTLDADISADTTNDKTPSSDQFLTDRKKEDRVSRSQVTKKQALPLSRMGNLPEMSTVEPVMHELARNDSQLRMDMTLDYDVSKFNEMSSSGQGVYLL